MDHPRTGTKAPGFREWRRLWSLQWRVCEENEVSVAHLEGRRGECLIDVQEPLTLVGPSPDHIRSSAGALQRGSLHGEGRPILTRLNTTAHQPLEVKGFTQPPMPVEELGSTEGMVKGGTAWDKGTCTMTCDLVGQCALQYQTIERHAAFPIKQINAPAAQIQTSLAS